MLEKFGLKFEDYCGDRLIHRSETLQVIIPKNCPDPVPIFCPVCDCAISGKDDAISQREVGCCNHCKDRWYYPNKKTWEEGWRPTEKIDCQYMKTVIIT